MSKIIKSIVLCIISVLLIVGMTACSSNEKNEVSDQSFTEVGKKLAEAVSKLEFIIEAPTEVSTEQPTEKPTEKPTERPTEEPTERPKETQKPVTNENNKVYEDNISVNTDNVLFIGNSLVEGIRICTNTNHGFLSVTGISLEGLKSNVYSQIANYNCDTVIIGMGTNELGSYGKDLFKKSYKDLINKIRSVNPDAQIICMSIPPVTDYRSSYDTLFNNNNVKLYNEYIKEICLESDTMYLDNTQFFGETLDSNWSGDGIHLTGTVYANWYNFIFNQIS